MKIKIAIQIVALVLCAAYSNQSSAQTNQVNAVTSVRPAADAAAGDLVTRAGTVYKKFHVEKVDASGILISYTPDNGGIGMTRISFDLLPDNLQKQYGYDPQSAPSSGPAPALRPSGQNPAPAPPTGPIGS